MTQPRTSSPRPDVLQVDDTPDKLTTIGELLMPHFKVKLANSGAPGVFAVRRFRHPS